MLASVDDALATVQRATRTRESGQHGLFGTATAPAPMPFVLHEAEPWGEAERLASEYAMLGFYVSGHPLAEYASKLQELKCVSLDQIEGQRNGKEIAVASLIVGTRPMRSKKGARWAIYTIQDMTGVQELLAFPESFARLEQILKAETPLLLKVRVQVEEAGTRLSLQEAARLGDLAERPASGLRIRLKLEELNEELLDRLEEIFSSYRGSSLISARSLCSRGSYGDGSGRTTRPGMSRAYRRGAGMYGRAIDRLGHVMKTKDKSKRTPTQTDRQSEIDRFDQDVEELRQLAGDEEADAELERIRQQVAELRKEFYSHLGPWQRAQIARHTARPYPLDYIGALFTDFVELHGDRNFGDDKALIAGLAKFQGRSIVVIGHQKGRDTKQRLLRNFGQPKPEGYRKALRVMLLAAKYGRPIFTFIDTPGAYPGIDAEERGQAEAIARNLREMARLPVPIIATVTGEGGSGGALAIAVGDRVNILENSFYSVISPEGCAAIMWRDATKAETAAAALKITANDLKELGIVDEIVCEPEGGAHVDPEAAAQLLGEVLDRQLVALGQQSTKELLDGRYEKFRKMGEFFDFGI